MTQVNNSFFLPVATRRGNGREERGGGGKKVKGRGGIRKVRGRSKNGDRVEEGGP